MQLVHTSGKTDITCTHDFNISFIFTLSLKYLEVNSKTRVYFKLSLLMLVCKNFSFKYIKIRINFPNKLTGNIFGSKAYCLHQRDLAPRWWNKHEEISKN